MQLVVLLSCVLFGVSRAQNCSLNKLFSWKGSVKWFEKRLDVGHVVISGQVLGRPTDIVYRYQFTSGRYDNVLEMDNIKILHKDSAGSTFVVRGSAPDGDSVYKTTNTDPGLSFKEILSGLPNVYKLFSDDANNLYIATQEGVRIYRPNGSLVESYIRDLSPQIDHFAVDSKGNVFLSQGKGNLAVLTSAEAASAAPAVRFVNGLSAVTGLLVVNDVVNVGTEDGLYQLTDLEIVTDKGGEKVLEIQVMETENIVLYRTPVAVYYVAVSGSVMPVKGIKGTVVQILPLLDPPYVIYATNDSALLLANAIEIQNEYSGWPNGQSVRQLIETEDGSRAFALADDLFHLVSDLSVEKMPGLPNGNKKLVVHGPQVFIASYDGFYRC